MKGVGGRNVDGWTLSFFSLSLSLSHCLAVRTKTGSPLHPASHTRDSSAVGVEDVIGAAGDGGSEQWNNNASCSNFKKQTKRR